MRRTSVLSHITSRPGHLVCPMCGSGKLCLAGLPPLASCDSCGCAFDHVVLRTLEQMVTLPDVLGKHACECGHPEMGRLPDGTFHCPACRSEVVLPTEPGGDTAYRAYSQGPREPCGRRRIKRT